MKILISGASGLIGTALWRHLQELGHEVQSIERDPATGLLVIEPQQLGWSEAVVHLAGARVAGMPWIPERRASIMLSRTRNTRLLAEGLASHAKPSTRLLCASAIGYYGDGGDAMLDESSLSGRGFLADVCRQWEAAAEPARAAGLSVAHMRIGLVLSAHGGFLKPLLKLFRAGLGGRLGGGKQYMSWITLRDAVEAIVHLLGKPQIVGPVNLVSPQPLTNAEFAKTLAATLRRPAWLPIPAGVVSYFLGDMGRELLLAGQRVQPRVLQESGYVFKDNELASALQNLPR